MPDVSTSLADDNLVNLKQTLEAALMAAGKPLNIEQLCDLFIVNRQNESLAAEEKKALRKPVRHNLKLLQTDCDNRGIELIEVASGFRYQVKQHIASDVAHLWTNRPTRYSRALLETLALVAYRQPITRSEIEKVRGVSVSSEIMRKLIDFGWVRIIGHRETAGRPRLYGSTKAFLDHFSLKSLDSLPPLQALRDEAMSSEKQFNAEERALSEAMMDGSIQAELPLESGETVTTEAAEKPKNEIETTITPEQKILAQWPPAPKEKVETEDTDIEADRQIMLPTQLLVEIDPDALSFDDDD